MRDFLSRHRLPEQFRALGEKYYLPLAEWIVRQHGDKPLLIGIGGAQGTGKSTLADFLVLALEKGRGWRAASLSLDDFYLTRRERERLAVERHPLFITRGVPGTHDVPMLCACLDRLRSLAEGEVLHVPRFDKGRDDRAAPEAWPRIAGPLDAILLEGWCVGSRPQPAAALVQPVNALERDLDDSGAWRRYVNDQLAGPYARAFAGLDRLVWLRAPSFDAVLRWRLEQERKLTAGGDGAAGMTGAEIARFVQHFERITRADMKTMPRRADAVLTFDEQHEAAGLAFRNG